uniref:Nucleolar protein 8 n=1 Tax=Pan paniscus TaxID=9597 RepID=A0A2R9AWV6_PANPA
MKTNPAKIPLYVDGLSQEISETVLQNPFSRFAEVSDVEIITRKDDHGNPQKVFAYISISVAEADLKKCISILNKTKWKGRTLQIQLAKESFLHRLAQEKEEAKAKKGKSTTGNINLLEKIGGVEFHMKAAPGTEVPGYKNWVVSKFGRVLLVLHLKIYHKCKIIKYDPSKYCHNLKKIGEDFTNTIPISSLTWELEGGNDPMRDFSDFHGPPKKIIKVQRDESSTGSLAMSPRPRWVIERPPLTQTSGLETAKKRSGISDDYIDSKDELRMMVAKEENLQRTIQSSINEPETDPFEVVRDNFKSGVHKLHSSTGLGIKNNASCHDSDDDITRNDCEYDSGDTDEIIAMKKNVAKVKNSTEFSQMEKSTDKKTSFKNRENLQERKNNVESALGHGLKALNSKSPSHSNSNEDADSASELADSEGDKEYNAMTKNRLRVNLTLADLEQLAGSEQKVSDEDTESDGPETTTQCKFDRGSNSSKTPTGLHRHRHCICLEDTVASLLEGEESTCEFQVFKGESIKKSLKDNVASNNINKDQNSMKHVDPRIISMEDGSPYVNGSSGELTLCQHAKKANGPTIFSLKKDRTLPRPGLQGSCKDSQHRSDSSSLTSLEKSPKVSSKDTQEIKTDFSLSISNSSDLSAKDKHAEDDEKHLAALEVRQKAKEVQKKLVDNALANLDGHPEDKLTHIIFGSDSECETEEISTQEQRHPGEEWVKESMGKTSGKLPDSSDDEESDSEDDSTRFKIKPQFEGRAGQKLMDLQSHFGTDDRFCMNSRFLESDSEDEQEEVNEKKPARKKSLLKKKRKPGCCTKCFENQLKQFYKGSVAAKKFKGIVHYDPTKQDHATYERKRDDKPKESKEKQKKKREEAEKLREVSKETYYNIAMDLKEIFQTSKYDTPWNEECGKDKPEEIQDPAQPSRFTFSFFDSDTKDIKEETHRIETVKPGKIEDPRFQDSSSEEEDVTEGTDHRKSSPGEAPLPEKETTRFFFFSKNDERLQVEVGSDLFWRGVGSNISRNSWDARTNNLRVDCQKKHKDAKRKMKPK